MLPTIFELQTLLKPPSYSSNPSRSSPPTTLSAPPPYSPVDPAILHPFARPNDEVLHSSSTAQIDDHPHPHPSIRQDANSATPTARQHPSLEHSIHRMMTHDMIPTQPTEADDILNPAQEQEQQQSQPHLHPTYLRALREFHLSQDPSNWGTRSPHHAIQASTDQQLDNDYTDYIDEIEGIRAPDELDELWTTGWRGWLAWIAEALADGVLVDPHGRVIIGPSFF